jgi:hypothetical protein
MIDAQRHAAQKTSKWTRSKNAKCDLIRSPYTTAAYVPEEVSARIVIFHHSPAHAASHANIVISDTFFTSRFLQRQLATPSPH